MSSVNWSFSDFVVWLRVKCEEIKELNSVIHLDVQNTARASVRLRIERGMRLGELTVWDDGTAHMAVLDLQSGDFVFERDGVSLSDTSAETGLRSFFECLEVRV